MKSAHRNQIREQGHFKPVRVPGIYGIGLFIIGFALACYSDTADAGAVSQKKQGRQEQIVFEAIQQHRQQMLQEQQAVQQAIQQRQQVMQQAIQQRQSHLQQQQAVAEQIVQQRQQALKDQRQAVQQVYHQALDEREQGLNQAAQGVKIQQGQVLEQVAQRMNQEARAMYETLEEQQQAIREAQQKTVDYFEDSWKNIDTVPIEPPVQPQVYEVVDISDLWKTLETSSRAWPMIMDQDVKVKTVSQYIEQFQKKGIFIIHAPEAYVQFIDSLSLEHPAILDHPFENILRTAAIIEYDFNNGLDKDVLARKILRNEQAFLANRRRLGL